MYLGPGYKHQLIESGEFHGFKQKWIDFYSQ